MHRFGRKAVLGPLSPAKMGLSRWRVTTGFDALCRRVRVTLVGMWLLVPAAVPAKAQVAAELHGTVVDRVTGAPVIGARVDLHGSDSHSITSADGRFRFRSVEPGPKKVRVTAVGYRPHEIGVEMRNGVTRLVQIGLEPIPAIVEEIVVQGARAPTQMGGQVFGRAAIDSSAARDLAGLLDGEAGLRVIRTGGVGSSATISIRGSSPDEVLVLLDGASLNDPITGAADLSTILLGTIEQVTVFRGAASARYGGGALAGVVALQSRQPTGRELGGRVEAGSFGERGILVRLGGMTRLAEWNLSGIAVGDARRGDGEFWYSVPPVRGGGDARRQNADASVANLVASIVAGHEMNEIVGRLEWLAVDRGMPGPVTQPTPNARQNQQRLAGALGLGAPIGGWLLEADATIRRQEADYRDPDPPARPAYHDSVGVSEGSLRLSGSGALGGGTVALGGEYRGQHFRGSTLGPGAPTNAAYAGLWATGRRVLRAGGGRLELSAAVRADRANTVPGLFVSPRFGASWAAGRLNLHLSWGQSFSAPTLSDQFFQEGVLVQPNPDLRPERVRGEWQIGAGLTSMNIRPLAVRGEVVAYRSDVDGMILWQPNFRFVWSPGNFDVLRRGVDASLHLTHQPSRVSLRGSYSLTEVEYAGPVLGGQVTYRPRHSAAVGAGVPFGIFRTDLDARFVGERRTVAGSPLNALPAYWIVDVGIAARFSLGSWASEAFLRIENLFDERAALLADYPLPSRAIRLGWGASRQ